MPRHYKLVPRAVAHLCRSHETDKGCASGRDGAVSNPVFYSSSEPSSVHPSEAEMINYYCPIII